MATRLKNIVIDEISLVDRGANQHAHVVLMKRDDGKPAPKPDPFADCRTAEEVWKVAESPAGQRFRKAEEERVRKAAQGTETAKMSTDDIVTIAKRVASGAERRDIRKRADYEAELDGLAKRFAEKRDVSFAEAYDAVLQTDEGATLYAASVLAPAASLADLRKAAPVQTVSSAEAELERLAKRAHEKMPALSYEQHFSKIMETPEGRRLYSESLGQAA